MNEPLKMTLKMAGQTFEVEVGDLNFRPIQVFVDGEEFEVWPEEVGTQAPQRPEVSRPPKTGAVSISGQVTAPIPGVIVSISVKEGDKVVFGQELCVLEAMKMKNQIRANCTGTVVAIKISVGDQVRQNQILVEYTD